MIDIKFLRENPEVVKENIRKKFQDEKLPLVDEVIELDAQSRTAQKEADDLRANRNKISKEIGKLMGQGKKEDAMAMKEQVNADAKRLSELIPCVEELKFTVTGSEAVQAAFRIMRAYTGKNVIVRFQVAMVSILLKSPKHPSVTWSLPHLCGVVSFATIDFYTSTF